MYIELAHSQHVLLYESVNCVHNCGRVIVMPRLEIDPSGLKRLDSRTEPCHVCHVKYETLVSERLIDGDLMIIDMLSVFGEPGHCDDLLACVERAHDGARCAVADDDVGAFFGGLEVVGFHEVLEGETLGLVGRCAYLGKNLACDVSRGDKSVKFFKKPIELVGSRTRTCEYSHQYRHPT